MGRVVDSRRPTLGERMAKIPDISEVLEADATPLKLQLHCNACGKKQRETFAWACIDPGHDTADKSWDGIVLSHAFRCKKCKTVDDYTLEPLAKLGLAMQALVGKEVAGTAVIAGGMRLWDGSFARRPSQAIAHLRKLADERGTAEAWRRLGNCCDKFGEGGQAVAAWTRAMELDAEELDAAWSLFSWHANHTGLGDVALGYLTHAVAAFAPALKKDPTNGRFAGPLANEMVAMANSCPAPLSLAAVWCEGERNGQVVVNASQAELVGLHKVARLEQFMLRDDLIGLTLTLEPTIDRPTRLERILSGTEPKHPLVTGPFAPSAPLLPIRVAKVPGRNDPCSCGSGKKYKKCCGV